MFITPSLTKRGQWQYRVEYDDGAIVEKAVKVPEEFGPIVTGTVFDKEIGTSEHLQLLESKLRVRLNDADDFMRMVESPEFGAQLSTLSGTVRQTFLLAVLQRAEYVFDLRDPVSIAHPIARFTNGSCNRWLFEHWVNDISREGRMYNLAGVFAELEQCDSPQSQVECLQQIIAECSVPMGCRFPDHAGGDDDRTPFITMLYPHSLTHSELTLLNDKLVELHRECGMGEGIDSSASAAPAPTWSAKLTDLVFIFDALEDEGYLSATAGSIMAHLNVKSDAKDRAKVYRDTRKKLQDGMAYPDRARLERLIERLRRGLE